MKKVIFFLKTILIYNDIIMTFETYETKNHSKYLLKYQKNILKNKVKDLVSNSSNYTKDVIVFFDGLNKNIISPLLLNIPLIYLFIILLV